MELSGNGLLPGTSITIEFSESTLFGSAGCNHYNGTYQVSGESLTISDLSWTEIGCPEPEGILEQEGAYLAALSLVNSYQISNEQLEILDGAEEQLFLFTVPGSAPISEAEEGSEQSAVAETAVIQSPSPSPPLEVIVTETAVPTAVPPPGFMLYEDNVAGVALFMPESWIVTFIDPGQWAILQSYPEDKYIGGEGLQPGDTKCDLNVRPIGTRAIDLLQEWKNDPDNVIISEEEVVLESGKTGFRIELDNRGRSLSLITDVNERAVIFTCFGNFTPFDSLASTLRGLGTT